MYRSVEDQLRVTAGGAAAATAGSDDEGGGAGGDDGVPDYQELRELAAERIRSHKDEFGPYLVPEDEGADPAEYYESYCDAIEATATWGGHVELQALSAALRRRIVVYGAGMAAQTLGEGFEGPPLTLCFLLHALGLGSHYNSTRPLLFGGGDGGSGGKSGGEGEAGAAGDDDE